MQSEPETGIPDWEQSRFFVPPPSIDLKTMEARYLLRLSEVEGGWESRKAARKEGLGRGGDRHADSWLGQEFCLLWGRTWPKKVTRGDHRIVREEMAPIHWRLEAASAWSCDLNRDTGLGDGGCSPHPTPTVWKVHGMTTKRQLGPSNQNYPPVSGNYSS